MLPAFHACTCVCQFVMLPLALVYLESNNVHVLQDSVQSYFGMRKISLGHLQWETNPRVMLNNQFVFHMGVLDQVCLCLQCVSCHNATA